MPSTYQLTSRCFFHTSSISITWLISGSLCRRILLFRYLDTKPGSLHVILAGANSKTIIDKLFIWYRQFTLTGYRRHKNIVEQRRPIIFMCTRIWCAAGFEYTFHQCYLQTVLLLYNEDGFPFHGHLRIGLQIIFWSADDAYMHNCSAVPNISHTSAARYCSLYCVIKTSV